MEVRILYNKDGSVGVITPIWRNKKKTESDSEFLKRAFDKATPKGAIFDDIEDSKLPDRKDREFWIGKKSKGISIKK